ncbi:MAG: glycerophosphodiester phosphodiesterase [Chloroflexi bacterium]|nr:MAG: glycerophosphodiester phosphodiesterase [Chloroflexota bacterium]
MVHDGTLRLAHQGDWREAAPNSLRAFAAAARVPGCDGVELDVRRSRDGQPVVIHDESLDRVQGLHARVDELTADTLEMYGVPRLASVLAALPRGAFLDVELKEDLGRIAVEVLAAGRGRALASTVISSFDPWTLRRIRGLAPQWVCWLNAHDLSSDVLDRAVELGCRGIAAEWHAIDRRSLAQAKEAGLQVAAWTVTRRSTFQRLARLGVSAVCVEGKALEG